MRLRILGACLHPCACASSTRLVSVKKTVCEWIEAVKTTQPDRSQHLSLLWRKGMLGSQRKGVQSGDLMVDFERVPICHTVSGRLKNQR